MPKVNPERDTVMAQQGYLRAAIVAILFGVKTSTVIRWPEDSKNKIENIRANGLNWLRWSDVYAFRAQEAMIRKLSLKAEQALLDVRKLK